MDWFSNLTDVITRSLYDPVVTYVWEPLRRNLFPDPPQHQRNRNDPDFNKTAPIIWLLGKTGAGKSSIIQAVTGQPRARVGDGFRSCTKTAEIFDFPADSPLIRFLDTRGLAEPGIDPAEDIAVCAEHASCILVVMKVMDPSQEAILQVVRNVRRQQPQWPVIVALTGLHQAYPPNTDHPDSYPFGAAGDPLADLAGIPDKLRNVIRFQRESLSGIPGTGPIRFVPIDFTQPEDGFANPAFGLEALIGAFVDIAPLALASRLEALADARTKEIEAEASGIILAWAFAGLIAGAVPIPFVDAAVLAGVLAGMLVALARFYQMELTTAVFTGFTSCLGSGVLLSCMTRYAGRELLKLIPVYGQTAALALSAAAAFAFVYAIGFAACVYFKYIRRNEAVPEGAIGRAFQEALDEALKRAARRATAHARNSEKPE